MSPAAKDQPYKFPPHTRRIRRLRSGLRPGLQPSSPNFACVSWISPPVFR